MDADRQPQRSVLVIANRTCPCPNLAAAIVARGRPEAIDVLVVAPALTSRLRHWVSDTDRAVARARERLAIAVDELRGRGVNARGEVGDANPLLAIEDALALFSADEIVVVTHPPGRSNWLEHGLIEKALRRFALPITHLVSDYGLDRVSEQPVAA